MHKKKKNNLKIEVKEWMKLHEKEQTVAKIKSTSDFLRSDRFLRLGVSLTRLQKIEGPFSEKTAHKILLQSWNIELWEETYIAITLNNCSRPLHYKKGNCGIAVCPAHSTKIYDIAVVLKFSQVSDERTC